MSKREPLVSEQPAARGNWGPWPCSPSLLKQRWHGLPAHLPVAQQLVPIHVGRLGGCIFDRHYVTTFGFSLHCSALLFFSLHHFALFFVVLFCFSLYCFALSCKAVVRFAVFFFAVLGFFCRLLLQCPTNFADGSMDAFAYTETC